jgi:energy-coupling factor transport system ATP-binding protein
LVEALQVSVRFAGHSRDVLVGLDLKVEPGEMIAVLGPNGSGKSTLARLLNGLIVPSSGRLLVGGHEVAATTDVFALRQVVGLLFQNPDLQMVSTVVEEELAFGPENLGLAPAEIRARVDEVVALLNLEAIRFANPAHLSGGQKQRVALASVLAMRPALLVLDEPTAMLDPCGRREVVWAVLEARRRLGMTVIWVTHTLEEARLADWVLLLVDGCVKACGPLRDVMEPLRVHFGAIVESWGPGRLLSLLEQGGLPVEWSGIVDEDDAVRAALACMCAPRGGGVERAAGAG